MLYRLCEYMCKTKHVSDWKYASVFAPNWTIGRRLLPFLRRTAACTEGTVVDLGCGDSPFRKCFWRAKHYVRIDFASEGRPDIIAQLPSIPLADGCCDVVFISQVLGDIPEISKMFNEINRILRPNGLIILHETMAYPLHDMPHDYFRVMPSAVRYFAGQTGFTEADFEFCGGLCSRIAVLLNQFILWRMGPIGSLFIAATNLVAFVFDEIRPTPGMADSYAVLLKKKVGL